MADCIGLIEREMLAGPWVMGETFTICDPYLFTICLWLEADGVDATKYPAVYAHILRMAARPAVKKVLELEWPNGHPSLSK
jgi:glutathione S-transferase